MKFKWHKIYELEFAQAEMDVRSLEVADLHIF